MGFFLCCKTMNAPVFSGCHSRLCAENFAHIVGGGIACHIGNLLNGKPGVCKKPFYITKAQTIYVIGYAAAHIFFENMADKRGTAVAGMRYICRVYGLCVTAFQKDYRMS